LLLLGSKSDLYAISKGSGKQYKKGLNCHIG
jgi:hypothetical protein